MVYITSEAQCFLYHIETQNKKFCHVHETTLKSTELTAFKEEHN